MSVNIHIYATHPAQSSGEVNQYPVEIFDAIQTPTDVTRQIINSDDPKQTYTVFVDSRRTVQEVLVYAVDDLFYEHAPVGTTTYDWAEEHINQFNSWVCDVEQNGYKIQFGET